MPTIGKNQILLKGLCFFVTASAFFTAHALPAGVKLLQKGSGIDGTPELHIFQLANGLKVLILEDDRNPVASLRIKLDAGSNKEVLGNTGLAHFFEHMMFRKTKSSEEGHYDRALSGVGGQGNAGTSSDYVVYESTFPGPAIDKMLELEAQRFTALDLKDPYFTTEKGAVISERKLRYENDPSQRAAEIIRAKMERGTPYEWLTIGAKADVENMSIDTAKQFYAANYTPDNAMLSLGGPFKAEDAIAKVNKYFGDWKGTKKAHTVTMPKDYLTRDLGTKTVCSEAVGESMFQMVYPNSTLGLQSEAYMAIFRQMLNDHPEGDFVRRLMKDNLANSFAFYKMSHQKKNPNYVAIFRLNKSQQFEPAQKFWDKAVQQILARKLDSKILATVLKQMDVSEAEVASKMSSLVENYEWAQFFYADAFADQKIRNLVKQTKETEFKNWLSTSLGKSYVTGVVPNGGAPACNTLLSKK